MRINLHNQLILRVIDRGAAFAGAPHKIPIAWQKHIHPVIDGKADTVIRCNPFRVRSLCFTGNRIFPRCFGFLAPRFDVRAVKDHMALGADPSPIPQLPRYLMPYEQFESSLLIHPSFERSAGIVIIWIVHRRGAKCFLKIVCGNNLPIASDMGNTIMHLCPKDRIHKDVRVLKCIDISPRIHLDIEQPCLQECKTVTVIDHPPGIFSKAQFMQFALRIIRIAHPLFVICPLELEERYAGKNIRRNVVAAALSFMPVDTATVRPDPFAWIDCPIPNTGKPYAICKHPISAHCFHSSPVHRLTLPRLRRYHPLKSVPTPNCPLTYCSPLPHGRDTTARRYEHVHSESFRAVREIPEYFLFSVLLGLPLQAP
ncbi:hypothetical protein HMPREF9162_0095 [Selenomonas sp. oral taxon 137 str. F0430]|nr:hypothetical protein HMPREF9162_0095 [Selenomonas sp. oral taxon 137 str. F0430]